MPSHIRKSLDACFWIIVIAAVQMTVVQGVIELYQLLKGN